MLTTIRNKNDLIAALRNNGTKLIGDYEVVNDQGLKALTDKTRNSLKQQKKLHVILIERA